MSTEILSPPATEAPSALAWHSPLSLVEERLDAILSTPLPYAATDDLEAGSMLREALRYSVFSGGKRLRSQLVLEAAFVVGNAEFDIEYALPAACAIELIHAYSLVHDDLPAMDNADTRRGRPSCHRKYGEANAILAGDALLTLAFEVLTKPVLSGHPSPDLPARQLRAAGLIARAAGEVGMVGGQTIDMAWSGQISPGGVAGNGAPISNDSPVSAKAPASIDAPVSGDALLQMHAMKTGALIRVSAEVGAVLGGGTEEQIEAMRKYGAGLGCAFQITDDVLDVIGDPAQTGKGASDAANGKSTAPAVFGLERAQEIAAQAVAESIDALRAFGPKADNLRALARFVEKREK